MFLRTTRLLVVASTLSTVLVANAGHQESCAGVTGRAVPNPSSVFNSDEQWLTPTSVGGPVHIETAVMMRNDVDSSKYAIEPVAAVENELFDRTGCNDQSFDDGQLATSNTCGWRPLDTLTLFGGLEGSKQPQDFGVNANFGSRWAANWGFPLLAEYGIGAQIGTSINYTDNAVQVFERVGASTHRTQNFSTIGIFQRTDTWRWGIAYDLLYESYYDQFFLGQCRGRVGYATSATDEFGVWFAVPTQSSTGSFQTISTQLSSLTQGSLYWQHQFLAGTRTMCWAGAAEGHAQANLALGDLKPTGTQFVFGAEIDVPLNSYFSIYGQGNFVGPASTGTVDAFLGLSYYPGGRAFPASRSPFAPFQALVNSTMFAVDMRRN